MNTLSSPCDLESVLATEELSRRSSPPLDPETESNALLILTRALASSPRDFFGTLVRSVLRLSGAGSTGISLLNEEEKRFVWPAVAGKLDSFLGSGTPSDFGPCGTVLERGKTLLFIHPEKHFTYLEPIHPPLEEVLLIPFYVGEKAVGTIWAVFHEAGQQFSAEHRRLLEAVSNFASSAYATLANTGALTPLLKMQPASS
ncbi:GAF domain-containing protein [Brevifollis gellanilyticus]|uniref:GAF domain-containing protein n=1 Tax=Brevifollis gellanilyticus TaxID=748831 RepID=A0A512MI87_9BACT|nr:GAF domain-containing protein [Brevifollis gellanilyticus]GEP46439.1 hypothetical protein BGE01nite_57300 [Brevifollis gellanilyticus]